MTLAEIIAKLKEDAEMRKALLVWSANETDEGKEFMTNFFNAEFDKKIGDKVSEIHTSYDNDVFEVLGQRKKTDQKTYDFVKELAAELKELRASKGTGNDAKIKELEGKIKELTESGSVNEHWKKIYDEALQKWNASEQELNDKLAQNEQEFRSNQVKTEIKSALGSVKMKEGIPQEAVDAMVKLNEEKVVKHAKIIDGKVVFHKEDGTPWMNEQYKPITAGEIVKTLLGTLIDEGTGGGQGGGGASTKIKPGEIVKTGEGDNATEKLVLDKASFSTKLEFNKVAEKALRSQGIAVGDKNYNKLLDEAYAEYGVSELELQ